MNTSLQRKLIRTVVNHMPPKEAQTHDSGDFHKYCGMNNDIVRNIITDTNHLNNKTFSPDSGHCPHHCELSLILAFLGLFSISHEHKREING